MIFHFRNSNNGENSLLNMKILIIRLLFSFSICILTTLQLPAQTPADSIRTIREALQLIELPDPAFSTSLTVAPSPKDIADMGFEQPNTSEAVTFTMRDGIQIHGQRYAHDAKRTVLLIHGVLSNSYTFNKMAGLLRKALGAEIIAIDLRGHGWSGGTPGDINTSNQYAEDVDDMLTAIQKVQPTQEIILAGHSMGGGIALRHAESFPETPVSGYLLFAPNLGPNSPTTTKTLELQNNFIKVHLARSIGLKMLNDYGIHTYDSLKVVFYNLPEAMPVRSYSYRSMEASVPQNLYHTLRGIEQPMLVLAGSKDEAFIAAEYPSLIQAYSNGQCVIVEGETHNGIRHHEAAMQAVATWAAEHLIR